MAGRLSVRQVQTLGAGMHADGDGLYLQVTATGARSWILRYQVNKRRREMGLGAFPLFGLADARQRAQEAKRLIADGIDPIESRKSQGAIVGAKWGDIADAAIESFRHGWKDSRRALEFTILTAARTGEVTGASWSEFNLDAKVWVIPGERMKAEREHVIPLTERAVHLLATTQTNQWPFALSENAMLYLLQRQPPKGLGMPYTVHGFRSAFSDWAHETTAHPNHVIEMALAHTIPNKAEAAYRRGALLDKRRNLMNDWAAFLAS